MPAVITQKSKSATPFWSPAARRAPPGKREGTLLERIRAKEAARKAQRSVSAQDKRDEFLISILPRVSRICRELSMSSTSYVVVDIAEKVCTSLRAYLSFSEAIRSLVLLSQKEPESYHIVQIGSVTVMKLQPPKCYAGSAVDAPSSTPATSQGNKLELLSEHIKREYMSRPVKLECPSDPHQAEHAQPEIKVEA